MHEGFDITFREVMPESSLIELVLEQLAQLHELGTQDRHCSVVLRRHAGAVNEFDAHVELEPERRGVLLHGEAIGHSAHEALCLAFADLRDHQLMH